MHFLLHNLVRKTLFCFLQNIFIVELQEFCAGVLKTDKSAVLLVQRGIELEEHIECQLLAVELLARKLDEGVATLWAIQSCHRCAERGTCIGQFGRSCSVVRDYAIPDLGEKPRMKWLATA